MAKLAVLISRPKTGTTHWPFSASLVLFPAEEPTQGRRLVCRVPRSRANCSKVSGRNDPGCTISKNFWFVFGFMLSQTYATNREHFSRNAIRVPAKDLATAGRSGIFIRISRWSLLHAFSRRRGLKGGIY
jgi:hypothetical protein